MKTLKLKSGDEKKAAEILKNGGIVAIPTETVYGLAASAFDENAVKKIFIAKGRPSDNPLIVHIADLNEIKKVACEFGEKAKKLAEKFWPGPLTMILPKSKDIPLCVTAGMPSVAVRFPSNKIANKIIKLAGVPLVAPSANLSGSPSPTKFKHVLEDLDGRVDAIVDGGDCDFGVESTVISMVCEVPRLLRPGKITPEQIEEVIGGIEIDDAVYSKLKPGQVALSPGMKYKHYAPKTKVYLVKGSSQDYADFINSKKSENILALCFEEDKKLLETDFLSYGSETDFSSQAKNIFSCLREADKLGHDAIYAHFAEPKGVGLAVYNRLIRSAGFDVIKL